MFEFALTDMSFIVSFLFVFAIIYGLLATAKVMTQKNVNVIIALVFAFFSATYEPFTAALQGIIPFVSVIFVVLFVMVFIKKLFVGKKKDNMDTIPIVVSLIVILAVLWATWDKIYKYFYNFGVDPMDALWIIGIIFVVLIFYAIYMHNPKESP